MWTPCEIRELEPGPARLYTRWVMQTQESLPERLVLAFRQTILPCCLAFASVLLTSAGISLRAATYNVAQRDPKRRAKPPAKSGRRERSRGESRLVVRHGGLNSPLAASPTSNYSNYE